MQQTPGSTDQKTSPVEEEMTKLNKIAKNCVKEAKHYSGYVVDKGTTLLIMLKAQKS